MWILILIVLSGDARSGRAVTSHEFNTQQNCVTAGRAVQRDVYRNGGSAYVLYQCAKK